jgi:hypothetical protein
MGDAKIEILTVKTVHDNLVLPEGWDAAKFSPNYVVEFEGGTKAKIKRPTDDEAKATSADSLAAKAKSLVGHKMTCLIERGVYKGNAYVALRDILDIQAGPTQGDQKPVPPPAPTVPGSLKVLPPVPPPVTLNGAELGNRMKLVVELACSRLGPGMTRDEYIDEMGYWWGLFANVRKTGVFPEVGKTEDDIPTEDEDLPF